jgi:hypothetical protein
MFSNLSKGSILYGLDNKGDIKFFTASIESISLPRSRYMQNTFGQIPETVIDIIAVINGEKREFKQVPSNNTIADFGPDTFVIADNKESLVNYINGQLQKSIDIVNSKDRHEVLIEQYKKVLEQLNPSMVDNNAVKELKGQVESMQAQLKEALALLKSNNKTI